MAKVKNISGDARVVPELGGRLVLEGEVVEIPDERLEAYACQVDVWRDDAAPEPQPKRPARKRAARKKAATPPETPAASGENGGE